MKTPYIRGPPLNPPAHARMGPGPLWPQPVELAALSPLLRAIEHMEPLLWLRLQRPLRPCRERALYQSDPEALCLGTRRPLSEPAVSHIGFAIRMLKPGTALQAG